MDELMNREYNGWENKFTWLVHLHLSDEQVLSLEIAQVIAGEPNDQGFRPLTSQCLSRKRRLAFFTLPPEAGASHA
jgi:hypothetical protein